MALRDFDGWLVEGLVPLAGLANAIGMIAIKDHRAIHGHIGGMVVVHDPQWLLAR